MNAMNVNTNTTNNTRPARRYYTPKEAAALMESIRAAVNSAEAAAAAAAEAVKAMNADSTVIYWNGEAKRAAAEANRAEAAAAEAAEAAEAAAKFETAKRFTPRRAAEANRRAEAAAAIARAAAAEAAEAAAAAIKKPTAAELREATNNKILSKIGQGANTPAKVWDIIAAEGYTLIKRAYFTAAIGEEAAAAYYKNITTLCGMLTASLLKYHTAAEAEKEAAKNTAFTALKTLLDRIGVKYAVTAQTIDILAARAYTYRRTYGAGYTAAALGDTRMLTEVLAHVTAADTIAAAAKAKAEAEARKEARRRERKAAKAAKAAAKK